MCLSSLNALTLSPAMSALLLKPQVPMRGPLGWFFKYFNRGFDWTIIRYGSSVGRLVRRTLLAGLTVIIFAGLAVYMLKVVPTGFVPDEDQGYFIVNTLLPEAASLQRNREVMDQVEAYLDQAPGIRDVVTLGGFNLFIGANSSYTTTSFVALDPWDERTTPELSLTAIMGRAQAALGRIQEALVMCFGPPPISGLSSTGGVQVEIQDRSGAEVAELAAATNQYMAALGRQPEVGAFFTPFSVRVPQLFVDVEREKVKKLDIPLSEVFTTLQTFLGGFYVNDFNRFGRTYQVQVQADAPYRQDPRDTERFFARTRGGDMVPLSTLTSSSDITGPEYLRRYNLYRAVELTINPAPGYSTGQLMAGVTQAAQGNLPRGFGLEWTGVAFQQLRVGGQTAVIFALALIMVFLVLAAQYESWGVPFAVLLILPLGIFGALAAQALRGLDNDVYAQIGLVMLIGLAAKNAILIVEFAKERHAEGLSLAEAALEASKLRFRPILMTALSFILGVLPLVLATGAGSASRHALGTSVFGGMLVATLFGVFLTPALYVIVQGAGEWVGRRLKGTPSDVPPSGTNGTET